MFMKNMTARLHDSPSWPKTIAGCGIYAGSNPDAASIPNIKPALIGPVFCFCRVCGIEKTP
jgi:hypothetical protein